MPNPQTDDTHARAMIASLACQREVMGYWQEARKRGLSDVELAALVQKKAQLIAANKWNDRMRSAA